MQGDPLERVCNSRQTEGVAWRRVRGERTIDRPSTRLTARSTVLEGTTPPRKPETILATWSGLAGDARTPDGRASDVAFLMRRGLDATQPSFALPSTLRRNEPHRHVGNMTACPVNKEPRTDRSWPSRCRRLPALAVRRCRDGGARNHCEGRHPAAGRSAPPVPRRWEETPARTGEPGLRLDADHRSEPAERNPSAPGPGRPKRSPFRRISGRHAVSVRRRRGRPSVPHGRCTTGRRPMPPTSPGGPHAVAV